MSKILVVDDSSTDRRLVASALSEHTVYEARNGDEGIAMARDKQPDLIIMDVVMPGKNGYQACRELKKLDETKNIPVIMYTSKSLPTDIEWGKRQGADEYLTKPFGDAELLDIVSRYL
jgi:twitching motility two-component system response regulator PilH